MKKTKMVLMLLPTALLAQSCNLFGSGVSGGIIKSVDGGENWQRMEKISEEQSLNGVHATDLIIDPSENQRLYLAASTRGLYKTENQAENWQNILSNAEIITVRVNPKNPQEIFAGGRVSGLAKVFRSEDAGSSWIESYSESRGGNYVSALAFDPDSPNIVYLGLSSGEIIRSQNSGISWNLLSVLQGRILRLDAGPRMFALSFSKGLYTSTNRGQDWNILTDNLKINSFLGFERVESSNAALYLATEDGLYRTGNLGGSWQKLTLPIQQNSVVVSSVAVNQKNPNEVYAAIASTFYKSSDAGATWQTRALGINAAMRRIVPDTSEANVVYTALGNPLR